MLCNIVWQVLWVWFQLIVLYYIEGPEGMRCFAHLRGSGCMTMLHVTDRAVAASVADGEVYV